MSGPAVFSGTIPQARVAAYVVTHILAEVPLNWVELNAPDVPVAVAGEVRGPGDDVRIELARGSDQIDVQSKHGLTPARLREWLTIVADRLPSEPALHVVLVVDPLSSPLIRGPLRRDLGRLRGGRTDELNQLTLDVRAHVTAAVGGDAAAADVLLARVHIVVLDLDHDDSAHCTAAVALLRSSLRDRARAEEAWLRIDRECCLLSRDQGRRDRNGWRRLLSRAGIVLAEQAVSEVPREAEIGHTSVEMSSDAEHGEHDPVHPTPAGQQPRPTPPITPNTAVPSRPTSATINRRAALAAGWRGMKPHTRGLARYALGFSFMNGVLASAGVWLGRLVPGAGPWAIGFSAVALSSAGIAVAPMVHRAAQLRRVGGISCPEGCGGAWLALDLAEVFRTRGYLGDLLQGEGAWAWCEGRVPGARHKVPIDWPIAYAEMVAALDAYRLQAMSYAQSAGASASAELRAAAAHSGEFAERTAALLRDGVRSIAADVSLTSTYPTILAAHANAEWPRGDREQLYRLLAALELWTLLARYGEA